ncbi:MAG: hypothetical protein FWD61_00370 [Phycisphaerales bacterium]|nr:hypothetical protein [Phycisphaerales bacterium]
MKKSLLCAMLVMFAFGTVALAQTTQPRQFVWSDYQKLTDDSERQAWLDANTPNSSVSKETRVQWIRDRASLAQFFGKVDDAKSYMAMMDADAARVGLKTDSLFLFYKVFELRIQFRDYEFAEAVALTIKDPKLKTEALTALYVVSNNDEKLLPLAVANNNHILAAKSAIQLSTQDKLDDKTRILEYGTMALKGGISVPHDAVFIVDGLVKYANVSDAATKKTVVNALVAFRKTIPPTKTENQWLEMWGDLAGKIDMQVQLLEVEIAREAAVKKDAAAK